MKRLCLLYYPSILGHAICGKSNQRIIIQRLSFHHATQILGVKLITRRNAENWYPSARPQCNNHEPIRNVYPCAAAARALV